jgi:hypothetical protein
VLAYLTTGRASSGPVEAVHGEIEQVDLLASKDADPRAVKLTIAGSETSTTIAPGCCSGPPSRGRLPSRQDTGPTSSKQTRRPLVRRVGPDIQLGSSCYHHFHVRLFGRFAWVIAGGTPRSTRLIRATTDDASRISRHNRVIRYVLVYDCPCSDHGAVPHGHAGKNNRTITQPYIVSDRDWSATGLLLRLNLTGRLDTVVEGI